VTGNVVTIALGIVLGNILWIGLLAIGGWITDIEISAGGFARGVIGVLWILFLAGCLIAALLGYRPE
jgi:hypothetical protein